LNAGDHLVDGGGHPLGFTLLLLIDELAVLQLLGQFSGMTTEPLRGVADVAD
jgi:hypothetical protein